MKNIHLLPTDKPSRLIQAEDDELMLLNELYENTYNINKHIYITSDERPNTNEYYIIDGIHEVLKNDSLKFIDNNCKKIILTTDQDLIKDGVQEIDDEFLKWFSKNPSCDEIEVNWVKTPDGIFYHKDNIPYGCYKIIIPKEKTKQESLEEAAERIFKIPDDKTGDIFFNSNIAHLRKGFKHGAKWQQEQDKNLYSEEDLLKFGAFVRIEDRKEKRLFLIQDYFKKWKQFKKK